MSVLGAGEAFMMASGDAGYTIKRSLRFDSGSSSHLSRTPSSAGNQKTWTWSGWVKRSAVGDGNWRALFSAINPDNSNRNDGIWYSGTGGSPNDQLYISFGNNTDIQYAPIFRDPSAWYHIVVAADTTQSTASDRIKAWVNGVQLSGGYVVQPAQNYEAGINNNVQHSIGRRDSSGTQYFDGYLADVHFLDGIAISDPDGVFGEFDADTGVWNPIKYTGTYGSSGVSYSNNSQITIDSGNYYLNNQDGPNGFDGNSSTYIDCRLGTGSNNTTNIIFEPTGGIANVTKIRVHSEYADDYRINEGTWTSFSSGGSYTQIYSGSAFTLTKLEIRRTSNGGSNYGHRVTAYEINDSELVNVPAGVNGFHLDFSDNSSDAALGYDAAGSNNWTVNNLTAQSVTGPSTGSSWFFDGSSGLDANDSRLALGTGDWTVEYFILPWNNYNGQSAHVGYNGNNPYFETDGSAKVRWQVGNTYGSSITYPNWYHIAHVNDGGQGAIWVNGTRVATNLTMPSNFDSTDGRLRIGQRVDGTTGARALFSNVHIVVGTAKYKRSQATIPIPHTPIPVIADTKLLALSTSTMTEDASGNNITLTATAGAGISINNPPNIGESVYQDSLIDSPTNYDDGTNVGGNYATLNPLVPFYRSSYPGNAALSQGNLELSLTSGEGVGISTIQVPISGKFYFEVTCEVQGSDQNIQLTDQGAGYGSASNSVNVAFRDLNAGSTLGIAVDRSAGTYTKYVNGTAGSPSSLPAVPLFLRVYDYQSGHYVVNFGQRPFQYPPGGTGGPSSDYKSLCTQNLDDPLIEDPSTAFDTKLWTGNSQQMTVGGPIYSASADSGVTNAGYMFNGDSNNGGYYNGTGTNKVLTTSPFTINTQLRIYNNFRSDGTYAICLNDSCINVPGSGTNSGVYRWSTVDLSSFSLPLDVTKLGYSLSQNSGNTIKLIEVDSSVLIDGNGDPYNFSPDLVWLKSRSAATYAILQDTVRGNNKALYLGGSAGTSAEATITDSVTSFNSDGYTLGSRSIINYTGRTYVGWAWDGGDLVTNSAYNQDSVWSATAGTGFTNADKAFDGSLTTGGAVSSSGNDVTITTASFTGRRIRFYKNGNNQGTTYLGVNGTDYAFPSSTDAEGWVEVDLGSATNVTSLTASWSPGAFTLYAVEVDGKRLVDTGVIPAGSQPISTYNQSQKWTDFWSSTSGFEQNSQTFAFDLNESNVSASASYGDTQSLVLTTGVAYTSSVRAMTHYTSGTAYINGNSGSAVNVASGWITLATGSGTLNRIDFTSSGARAYVSKIEVDGKLLVDPTPSIASTVRVNPTAGFSIVKFQAPNAGFFNVAHHLNAKPDLIISKHTNRSSDWYVWHSAFTDDGDYINLNTANAKSSATDFWSAAKPDSYVFGGKVGTSHIAGDTDIAYCWTSVEGHSKFGSYISNNNVDGPFVFLGFQAKLIIWKNQDANHGWYIYDDERDPDNPMSKYLAAHDLIDEGDPGGAMDILSNGFKVRNTGSDMNTGSNRILYMAWAEYPFKYVRAR